MFNRDWVWESTIQVKPTFSIKSKYWEKLGWVAASLGVSKSKLIRSLICVYLWFNRVIEEDELHECDSSGLARDEDFLTNTVEALAYMIHFEDDSINFLKFKEPKHVVLEA